MTFYFTYTLNSFLLNLICLPFIAIGAWSGIWLVKRIPEKQYRWLVIGMTGVASIFMLV
jgi:uncharacterized membrane protein YfcA|tara:strand:+ start:47 stop:223 length:177 start_codon:yes stop_codon:yes gene_type:complete